MVYIKSDPKQIQLLPTNLRTIIPESHICYLIESFVHELNYNKFDEQVQGPRNPSYHPRILLQILIYGIFEKITSSKKLEKATYENIIFRYLSESLNPDFHTISNFRKNNHDLIKETFLQTIIFAKELDMINFNKLYLDGTKIKANASKSKNFSKEEIEYLSQYYQRNQSESGFSEDKRRISGKVAQKKIDRISCALDLRVIWHNLFWVGA